MMEQRGNSGRSQYDGPLDLATEEGRPQVDAADIDQAAPLQSTILEGPDVPMHGPFVFCAAFQEVENQTRQPPAGSSAQVINAET